MNETQLLAEPGKLETTVVRTLEAPRDFVFKVINDPKLVLDWWGPKSLTTTVDEMDVRPGGSWRFVQRDGAGQTYAFRGVYHSVREPELIISTFEWEGMPGHVLLHTVRLEELDGLTKMTEQSVFQSVVDRDGMLKMGMKDGARETTERLNKLLKQLQPAGV